MNTNFVFLNLTYSKSQIFFCNSLSNIDKIGLVEIFCKPVTFFLTARRQLLHVEGIRFNVQLQEFEGRV